METRRGAVAKFFKIALSAEILRKGDKLLDNGLKLNSQL
jgi:hypothetical protein